MAEGGVVWQWYVCAYMCVCMCMRMISSFKKSWIHCYSSLLNDYFACREESLTIIIISRAFSIFLDTIWNILNLFSPVNLIITLSGACYDHSHFADEKIEAQKISHIASKWASWDLNLCGLALQAALSASLLPFLMVLDLFGNNSHFRIFEGQIQKPL